MTKTKKLIIVGDSAFAEIAREYFEVDTEYEVVAFTVEGAFLKRDAWQGLPVVPFEDLESRYDPAQHEVFAAITYGQLNRLRTRLAASAKTKGYKLARYVSPRAFVWRNANLGEHCFVFEDNTIQPFVEIGDNAILWSGNHVGHHSKIGNNCFISSHVVISGYCEIGDNTFLGVNATLANNVAVGKDNWVGPNTALMHSTKDGALFKTPHAEPSAVSAPRFFKLKEQ